MGFRRVAVATGRTFPDALAAAALLGRQHGMLLLMDDTGNATFALAREHRGECEGLTVLGGTAAVSASLVEALSV